ncbi:MAG: tryptophan--tRNA ligase [Candidatus Bathyarchaeia archaeon]
MTGEGEGGMVVTPWRVSGEIDYDRLINQFGTQPITTELLERIKKFSGELHLQLRRKIFFSHRDLDWILNLYERGEQFVLYTGRGPSGPVHLGHIVPWLFTRHLQNVFKAKLYFQMTDDEKFLIHQGLSIKDVWGFTYDNALDVVAVGFDQAKTKIISNIKNISALYDISLRVAKHVTLSTAKATFGFDDSSNIGIIYFPALQAAPAFLESAITGRNVPCLIPAAIDQDPYWRITRDVAPKLGYYKPAQIHSRFLPGLGREGKMSTSQPETCIFTVDPPEVAVKKVMNAFTGGRPTVEEQRKLGGDPEICPVYHYFLFLFEEDDAKLAELWENCRTGKLLCGECKEILAGRVSKFLRDHQANRERAKDVVDGFFLEDAYLRKKFY